MAIITNPGIALALVRAEQRRRGDWSDLTVDQLTQTRQVIRDDQRGQVTHADIVTRLRAIGGHTPDEAA
jgi:hypothetical protein